MENVLIALIAATPPTVAAWAGWRNAKAAKHQTNGALSEPLKRIEDKVDAIKCQAEDLAAWQRDHLGRWHQN